MWIVCSDHQTDGTFLVALVEKLRDRFKIMLLIKMAESEVFR